MSIRELTKLQTANGTAIVGADLEQTFQEVTDTLNSLQPKHLRNALVRKVRQYGHSPSILINTCLPWMTNFNGTPSAATLETPTTFSNPWRIKGDYNEDINPTTGLDGALWNFEVAEYLPTAHIIRRVVITALTDGDFPNDMLYNNPAPPFHGPINSSVNDLTFTVTADDQYSQEDRGRIFPVTLRRDFRMDSFQLARFAPVPGTDTMLPPFPTDAAVGFFIDVANPDGEPLNIPVPAKTRLRFVISIPEYIIAAWSTWTGYPWKVNTWGLTVWLDEPVGGENG